MECKYIVIEGPDCVGKGFFIEQFVSFIKRPSEKFAPFDRLPPEEQQALESAALTGVANDYWPNPALAPLEYRMSKQEIQPNRGLSIAVAEISHATAENKEFTRALHAGELSQEQIAEGYLQVIYDHHNYAKLLGQTHDIVLLDRSLPSYYAYQLCALGFDNMSEKWKQLYEIMMNEVPYRLIHLDAPVDVITERKAKKKGVSAMDDVYHALVAKIRNGYADCYAKGYYPVRILVDATATGERPYDDIFNRIVIGMNTSLAL